MTKTLTKSSKKISLRLALEIAGVALILVLLGVVVGQRSAATPGSRHDTDQRTVKSEKIDSLAAADNEDHQVKPKASSNGQKAVSPEKNSPKTSPSAAKKPTGDTLDSSVLKSMTVHLSCEDTTTGQKSTGAGAVLTHDGKILAGSSILYQGKKKIDPSDAWCFAYFPSVGQRAAVTYVVKPIMASLNENLSVVTFVPTLQVTESGKWLDLPKNLQFTSLDDTCSAAPGQGKIKLYAYPETGLESDVVTYSVEKFDDAAMYDSTLKDNYIVYPKVQQFEHSFALAADENDCVIGVPVRFSQDSQMIVSVKNIIGYQAIYEDAM